MTTRVSCTHTTTGWFLGRVTERIRRAGQQRVKGVAAPPLIGRRSDGHDGDRRRVRAELRRLGAKEGEEESEDAQEDRMLTRSTNPETGRRREVSRRRWRARTAEDGGGEERGNGGDSGRLRSIPSAGRKRRSRRIFSTARFRTGRPFTAAIWRRLRAGGVGRWELARVRARVPARGERVGERVREQVRAVGFHLTLGSR